MNKHLHSWKKRQELKIKCVEYLGGKCVDCGYNECIGSLDFHHCNPEKKNFEISYGIRHLFRWEKLVKELALVEILCSNCHRKHHWMIFNDINTTLREELGMRDDVDVQKDS